MPPRLFMAKGGAPANAVVTTEAVCVSAMRSAYWLELVLRNPSPNGTLSEGLFGFGGWASDRLPHPGSLTCEPPAQTPPSKSAMNQGPVPAPDPQKAVPKNS